MNNHQDVFFLICLILCSVASMKVTGAKALDSLDLDMSLIQKGSEMLLKSNKVLLLSDNEDEDSTFSKLKKEKAYDFKAIIKRKRSIDEKANNKREIATPDSVVGKATRTGITRKKHFLKQTGEVKLNASNNKSNRYNTTIIIAKKAVPVLKYDEIANNSQTLRNSLLIVFLTLLLLVIN